MYAAYVRHIGRALSLCCLSRHIRHERYCKYTYFSSSVQIFHKLFSQKYVYTSISVHEAGTTISFCPPMLHHHLWHNVIIPPVLLTFWFLEPSKFEGLLHEFVFYTKKHVIFKNLRKHWLSGICTYATFPRLVLRIVKAITLHSWQQKSHKKTGATDPFGTL